MIARPYLLVLNIPLHRRDNRFWADPLWHKDLEAHRVGIENLAIACPVIDRPPPAGFQQLSDIVVEPLPVMDRLAPLRLPAIALRLWRAIGTAAIVHTGIAGWPFPLGWIAIPIARWRQRTTVIVVESAFWRLAPGATASWLGRARAALSERINRRAVAACDIRFFTTDAYRRELGGGHGTNHVMPAIWIDDAQLIDPARLADMSASRRGRLLFAGRLTAAKGVAVLLEAIERSGVPVDFLGEGTLAEEIRAIAARRPDLIRLLDPVPYGAPFMALLDEYSALIVPTLTEEQPRVIFDAFSRGVAVLASDTAGNRQIVDPDQTGILFKVGSVDALVEAMMSAYGDPVGLQALGVAARSMMQGRTHAAMHAARVRAIEAELAANDTTGAATRLDQGKSLKNGAAGED